MNEYEALANAIIEQAARDYRAARRKLTKKPHDITAQKTVREVDLFFHSDWFRVLTTLDGPKILMMLKEEFDA